MRATSIEVYGESTKELKMEGMTREQFNRKYIDTHKGIHCVTDLNNGAFNKGSLIKESPSDHHITTHGPIEGKKMIEKKGMEERADDKKHYIMDAVSVRQEEILDKDIMPFPKLLDSMIKIMPQKVEAQVAHFTFADMIKQATMDEKKTINIEKENKE